MKVCLFSKSTDRPAWTSKLSGQNTFEFLGANSPASKPSGPALHIVDYSCYAGFPSRKFRLQNSDIAESRGGS